MYALIQACSVFFSLTCLLDNARVLLADLYEMTATQTVKGPHGKPTTTTNQTALARASFHRNFAADLRAAILDLFWDAKKLAFYDFNLTSNARNDLWSTATFYPYWNNIIPDEVLSSPDNAFGAFSAVNMVVNKSVEPGVICVWRLEQTDTFQV